MFRAYRSHKDSSGCIILDGSRVNSATREAVEALVVYWGKAELLVDPDSKAGIGLIK